MRNSHHVAAFTRIELLIVLIAITILVALAAPFLNKARAKAQLITCNGHLKNVGLAYRIFATDHHYLFPWQTNTARLPSTPVGDDEILRYFLAVTNELSTPVIIACPSDTRKPVKLWSDLTRQNIGYFVSTDASEMLPQIFLSGDRNLTMNGIRFSPGRVRFGNDTSLAWDDTQHKLLGDVCLADGSVQQTSTPRLNEQWRNTGLTTNQFTFLFP